MLSVFILHEDDMRQEWLKYEKKYYILYETNFYCLYRMHIAGF